MPDANGKLTIEDKNKFSQRIGGLDHACPFCHSRRTWVIGDHLVQPVTIGANSSLRIGGIGYPQAMLICSNCASTQFFNAVLLNIVPGSEKDSEDK